MPKVLLYITAKIIWQFLFYNTDYKQGDLTDSQIKEVLQIAEKHKTDLMQQWQDFKAGKKIKMIKIKR